MDEALLRTILFVCDWSANPDEISEKLRPNSSVDIRIVKVKCTGRVDPVVVLEAFLKGFDGVLLMGCEPENCHFIEGTLHAQGKVKMLKRLLKLAGFQHDRIDLELSSVADMDRFSTLIKEFGNRMEKLGQSPLSGDHVEPEIQEKMQAAKAVVEDFRIRALTGKELELTKKGNVYGEKMGQLDFHVLEGDALETEFLRHRIRRALKTSSSVKELSNRLNLDPRKVLLQIVSLQQMGVVHLDRIEGITPLYIAEEEIR